MVYQGVDRNRLITYQGDVISVKYGFHWLFGNKEPYFSITGKTKDYCGCIHDTIWKEVPHLRPLIKWHLCCQESGLPMYYMANGVYFLEKAYGIFRLFAHFELEEADPHQMEIFKSHVFYGYLPGDVEGSNPIPHWKDNPKYDGDDTFMEFEYGRDFRRLFLREVLSPWMEARIPLIKALFLKEMQDFDIPYMVRKGKGWE